MVQVAIGEMVLEGRSCRPCSLDLRLVVDWNVFLRRGPLRWVCVLPLLLLALVLSVRLKRKSIVGYRIEWC